MDKQIIDEFNRLYFSKKQLERRIYKVEDFREIWSYISNLRMEQGIGLNLEFSENNKIYYSEVEEIRQYIREINKNRENEIWNYISASNKSKMLKKAITQEVYNSLVTNHDDKGLEKSVQSSDIVKFIIDLEKENQQFNYEFMEKIYKKILLITKENMENIYKSEENKLILDNLLDFIKNDKNTPILIKGSIINFYITLKKPFCNYNECIAMLASYSYLILNGYEIVKYTSISKGINNDNKRYNNAIENCVDASGDLTYFIKYYIGNIKDSIISFNKEISAKYGRKILKSLIEDNNINLEKRISEFIDYTMGSNNDVITIEDYKKTSGVSYETARTDLNSLVTLGVFKISKTGKKYEYYINDISTIIDSFSE